MNMDQILKKLVLPDNVSLSEGTNELKEALKNPEAIIGLCSAISQGEPQIRQMAAVILRRKLSKHRYWIKMPIETRQFVKTGLMQTLVSEPEKYVKAAIGQVIGVLIRHEFPENRWPELLNFIQQMTTSDNINDKELGFFTLEVLTDMAPSHFLNHAPSFAKLFASTLAQLQDLSSNLAHLTVLCMANFTSAIEGHQQMVDEYHRMLPQVLAVVKALAPRRPDKAVEALQLITNLIDNAMTVIVPNLKLIVQACLDICSDKSIDGDLQIQALNTISLLVQTKKKNIVKNGLVEPIVDVLFRLMCVDEDGKGEEKGADFYPDMEEVGSPAVVAHQTLDILALHIPPDKLLSILMDKYVVVGMSHADPLVRKAAYMALAVVSEGAADCIRQRHMQTVMSYVMCGLKDPSPIVVGSALFAIGQFSEHLQPNISVHAQEVVPILLEHLQHVGGTSTEEQNQKVDRMFYALERFCENLNENVLAFLPMLMTYLVPLMSPPHSVRLRELAISAVGACGSAAKEEMMPYFPQVMENLKIYLTEVQTSETLCLQVQSVDTLAILAQTVGEDNFRPLASDTMQLGIQLITKTDDPDLRKATYGLFAAVATVLKTDMGPYLNTVMEALVKSLQYDCSSGTNPDDENNPNLRLFDNLSDNEDTEEELGNSSDVSSEHGSEEIDFNPENSFLEEKEEAVVAIKELALNCGEVFLPYVEKCFEEIFKLVSSSFGDDDIISACFLTLAQLCITLHKVNTSEANQALLKALAVLVPKCAEAIRTEGEREVVIAGLEAFQELLREIGSPVLQGYGHTEAFINCVKDVLTNKTACQDAETGDEDEEAERDELMMETAGEIVPLLGKVMPPQEFVQHYSTFYPMFVNLTQRKQASDAQKSFGVGMIADCMGAAAPCIPSFANKLLHLLYTLAKDECDEVRNNAVFALGELVYHGKESIYPYYGEILQLLSSAVMNETNPGALDNICGALARLIITNVGNIPLNQVIPVFVRYLPLREDFEENKWIYQSLAHLYQMGCEPLVQNLNQVIKCCALTLHSKQIEAENQNLVVNLLRSCHRDFPTECAQAASELPEAIASTLKQACVN